MPPSDETPLTSDFADLLHEFNVNELERRRNQRR